MINKKTIAVLVILLAAGAFIVPRLLDSGGSETTFRTAEADRGDVVSLVASNGTVNPLLTIDVSSRVAGTVSAVNVDFNDRVSAGDPLAEIDPSLLRTELRKAEADTKKAEAEFNMASSLYKSNKELYSKRLIPKEEFDDSQSRYATALAAYEQAKVALDVAKTNAEGSVIRAPIDGMVLSRSVDPGESVTADGKTLFVISSGLDEMKIDARVSEADIGRVSAGQSAKFRVDAYPNDVFGGTVTQVRNEPVVTNNVVTYNVVVMTKNDSMKLKPGMSAEVRIVVSDRENVLRVPTAALRFIPPSNVPVRERPDELSGDSYVWVELDGGRLGAVPVKPGASDGVYTEILEGGLKEGQKVIVEAVTKGKSDAGSSLLPQPRRF
ncbi:MAG TPA: efflux RND transporter periplasmic adaptor subunit [Thermodesulfobacteriota bacterium]|nr:efflux RND transporter periplasmic adaptor subunit [Thermodesulfobacteriota bacterium]